MKAQRRLERSKVRPVRRPQYDDDVDPVRTHQVAVTKGKVQAIESARKSKSCQ